MKWGCIAPVICLLLVVVAILLVDAIVPSGPRRALPKSASDIQEYYSDSWNGDFVRIIKAKLPEKDYVDYANELKIPFSFDASKHEDIRSMIDMGAGDAPSWWNPPSASETTFFDHVKGDDYVKSLKYSNGTVYLFIASW
jgi:hypothetical protein